MTTPEESRQPVPSIAEISDAYTDILTHNEDHAGSMFGGLMIGPPDPEPDPTQHVDFRIAQGEMSAGMQDLLHSDTFARAGLTVDPFGAHLSDAIKPAAGARLVPIVTNRDRYVQFLETVQPNEVESGDGDALLGDVVGTLYRTVGMGYSRRRNDPERDESEQAELRGLSDDALRTFDAIDAQYARLGLDADGLRGRTEHISPELSEFLKGGGLVPRELVPEYQRYQADRRHLKNYAAMTNCLNYWGRGLLPEYLFAESKQYLTPPELQGFGPAQWHQDGDPARWADAIAFVGGLERDERTREFGAEVRAGLVRSLDSAIAAMDAPGSPAARFAGSRGDLENLRNMFGGHEYDAPALAAYFESGVFGRR